MLSRRIRHRELSAVISDVNAWSDDGGARPLAERRRKLVSPADEGKGQHQLHLSWLKKTLIASEVVGPKVAERRAPAIYSGTVGAQLMARNRADIALYDSLIESYRKAGLLPA